MTRIPRTMLRTATAVALCLGIATAAVPHVAHAAAIDHVTSCLNGPTGSLSYVIQHAGDGDTIVFDQDCSGGNAIYQNQVPVSTTLTIDGTGHAIDFSGTTSGSFLHVLAGGDLTVENLTFQNYYGYFGAIENQGTLDVQNSSFVNGGGNWSAGLSNLNLATVSGSTFSGDYGNISGGLLALGATTTVSNSTFTANHAGSGWGAGVMVFSFGPPTPSATVVSSTFSGNLGTPVWDSGILTLADDIVANSTGANCAFFGAYTDAGYNLEDDTANNCRFSTANHDTIGQNPGLGSLSDNGGPTQTFALPGSSPAVNAGSCSISGVTIPVVDQRGVTRPQGASCDIGAFEYNPHVLTVLLSLPAPYTSAASAKIYNNGNLLGTDTINSHYSGTLLGPISLSASPVILATLASPSTYFFTGFQLAPPSLLSVDATTYAVYTTIEQQLQRGLANHTVVGQQTYNRLLTDWQAAEHTIAQPMGGATVKETIVKQFACDTASARATEGVNPTLAGTLIDYAGRAFTALGGTLNGPLC